MDEKISRKGVKFTCNENGLDTKAMSGVEKVLIVENAAARHILSTVRGIADRALVPNREICHVIYPPPVRLHWWKSSLIHNDSIKVL